MKSYFIAKTDIGKFSFGNWDQKLTGVNGVGELEVLDYTFIFIPFIATGEELPIDPGFMIKWAASGIPDGMILELGYGRESTLIWATLGYATEKWGMDRNYVRFSADFGPFDITSKNYSANAYFKPVENITLYTHYTNSDIEDLSLILPPGFDFDLDLAIVGVYGEFGKFFARYEYDTNDKSISFPPIFSLEGHQYGYQIGYNFSNKITAYYEYSTFCNIDIEKALYLKVKFK